MRRWPTFPFKELQKTSLRRISRNSRACARLDNVPVATVYLAPPFGTVLI
jgi:hypothetical protein